MLSKKLKTIITKVIVGLVLICSLVLSSGMRINTYKVNATPIERQEQRVNNECFGIKGKILIYHSHTNEKNKDMSIVEMGNDLTKKLELKGYKVEHITEDFTRNGYNNAYHSSRKMLESKDLKSYDLIIDYHADASDYPIVSKDVNGNDIAKVMIVNTKQNPNRIQENKIGGAILSSISEYSKGASRGIVEMYNRGIIHYNQDMNDNIILLEMGGNNNGKWDVARSNTYVANGIDKYIMENIKK